MAPSDHHSIFNDEDIWAAALWVEGRHGARGWLRIAQQMDRQVKRGDLDRLNFWRAVGRRWEELQRSDVRLN